MYWKILLVTKYSESIDKKKKTFQKSESKNSKNLAIL
jgi:hypothetical protein